MFESVQSALDRAGPGARMGELASAAMFGGTLVTAIITLLYASIMDEAFSRDAPVEPMRAQLVARQSWSEVRYEPFRAHVVANELRVPLGRPLELLLPDGTPLRVTAMSPPDFEEWLARQAAPSVTPTNRALQAGRAAFFRARCDDCHRIRGTAAHGRSGPDLTHVGARVEAASPELAPHLRAAVTDPEGDLHALTAYLASLK